MIRWKLITGFNNFCVSVNFTLTLLCTCNVFLNNPLQLIWFLQTKFKTTLLFKLTVRLSNNLLKFDKQKPTPTFIPKKIFVKNSFVSLFFHSTEGIYFSKNFFKYINKYKFFLWRKYKLQKTKFLKYLNLSPQNKILKGVKLFKNTHILTTPLNYLNPKIFVINKIKIKKTSVKAVQLTKTYIDFKNSKQNTNKLKLQRQRKVFFQVNNYSQLNLKNQTPFFNKHAVSLFLKKFKLTTSRFLKYDVNQVVIKYNLKRVRRSSKLMSLKKKKFFSSISLLNSNQLPVIRKNKLMFNKYIKKFRKRFSRRRVLMFWISKINQKQLTISRRNYKILIRKNLIRQKRHTKFIIKYYNFKVMNVINALEFTLLNVLMRSGLVSYRPTAQLLIDKNFLYLNNKLVQKFNLLLQKHDVLQFILSIKFVLYIKWTSLNNNLIARRFFFYLRKWRNRKFRPYPKTSSHRIPNWIRRRLLYKEPTAAYVETDLISYTSIVVFDWTTNFFNYHYMSLWSDIPAVVRPLNWKSLT